MNPEEITDINKQLSDLDKRVDELFKWLTKNVSSNCFESVLSTYNEVSAKAAALRDRIALSGSNIQLPDPEFSGSLPMYQPRNGFKSH